MWHLPIHVTKYKYSAKTKYRTVASYLHSNLYSQENNIRSKMKCVIFTILVIAMAITASQGEDTCSPWLGLCHQTTDCCRYLICSGYQAKCVPKGGLIIPGEDTRPLGPGPYPPNIPEHLLKE